VEGECLVKAYEVEYRAVITLAAEDMQKAALYGAAVIKNNGSSDFAETPK
jgi:hypothetical protein